MSAKKRYRRLQTTSPLMVKTPRSSAETIRYAVETRPAGAPAAKPVLPVRTTARTATTPPPATCRSASRAKHVRAADRTKMSSKFARRRSSVAMRMLLVKRPSRLDRATTKALSRIATVAVDSRMSASAFGLNSRTRRTSLTSNLPRTARQTSLPSYILRNNGDSFTASQVLAPPLTIEKTLALPNLTAYAERLLGCA
jgi:hypothetical protein